MLDMYELHVQYVLYCTSMIAVTVTRSACPVMSNPHVLRMIPQQGPGQSKRRTGIYGNCTARVRFDEAPGNWTTRVTWVAHVP